MSIDTALAELGSTIKGKADSASPVITGDGTVPTASIGDNDNSIANTAFVKTAIDNALSASTVYFSKDFIGGNTATDPIGLKPFYLSNVFKGSGSTTTDPVGLDSTKLIPFKTPPKSSAPGVVGEICMDDKYLYRYIATNRWVRVAFSTGTW